MLRGRECAAFDGGALHRTRDTASRFANSIVICILEL